MSYCVACQQFLEVARTNKHANCYFISYIKFFTLIEWSAAGCGERTKLTIKA